MFSINFFKQHRKLLVWLNISVMLQSCYTFLRRYVFHISTLYRTI